MSSYTKSTYEASMGHYVSDEGRKKRQSLCRVPCGISTAAFFPAAKASLVGNANIHNVTLIKSVTVFQPVQALCL